MSKFIDRLKQVFQPPPPPMGFRPKNVGDIRPKIQLVAHLHNYPQSQIENLAAADAIVMSGTKTIKNDILHGIWLTDGTFEEVDKAIETGADFAVLPASGAILPSDKKIGKVLQINSSVTDVLLRTVNDLPLDAVLIGEDSEKDGSITWQKLMLCRRFTGMLTKPVLAPISPAVTAAELQLIWEARVSGVIIDVKSATDIAVLENLRKLINGLQYPSLKRQEKLTPILPQAVANTEKPEEPDEDDDDD